MMALKKVPLSMAPVLETTQYIFVAVLSVLFLKETISNKKKIGFVIIIMGIFVYSM